MLHAAAAAAARRWGGVTRRAAAVATFLRRRRAASCTTARRRRRQPRTLPPHRTGRSVRRGRSSAGKRGVSGAMAPPFKGLGDAVSKLESAIRVALERTVSAIGPNCPRTALPRPILAAGSSAVMFAENSVALPRSRRRRQAVSCLGRLIRRSVSFVHPVGQLLVGTDGLYAALLGHPRRAPRLAVVRPAREATDLRALRLAPLGTVILVIVSLPRP